MKTLFVTTAPVKFTELQVGDYSRVKNTNHADNTITVQMEDGRELTYNPSRLSGVGVYKESAREFAEGDRIQFRAPFVEKRLANGELGSIVKIENDEFRVALDSGREIGFETQSYRHIDHGYAVTSHSSQGQTVDRVLINADTRVWTAIRRKARGTTEGERPLRSLACHHLAQSIGSPQWTLFATFF